VREDNELHAFATIGHVSTWRFHEGTNSTFPLPLISNHACKFFEPEIERMHGLRENRKPTVHHVISTIITWTAASIFFFVMSFESYGKCDGDVCITYLTRSLPCAAGARREIARACWPHPAASFSRPLAYINTWPSSSFSLQNTQTHSSLTTGISITGVSS